MVLALAAGLLLGGVPVDTIWVAVPPEVAPCTVNRFAGAFRVRLGQVAVLSGTNDRAPHEVQGELQVAVRRAGKSLELRVRAAAKRELVRGLPGPGSDCLAASETAALIVERYLDEVEGGTQSAASSLTPLPPPAAPARWGIDIELSVAAELAVLPQVAPEESTAISALGPGGSIAIGVRRGRWQLSARGTLEPAATMTINGAAAEGSLHLQAGATALALDYRLPAGPGAVRFEGAPGIQLFSVTTSSPYGAQFGQIGSKWRVLPFIGAGVGYEVPLWKQLSALAVVVVRAHLGSSTFEVEGVLTVFTRQLDGEASLGLGYVFY